MSTAPAPSALSDLQYQQHTSELLSRIESTVDRWLQDDVVDIDTQRTGGLLEMSFPDGAVLLTGTGVVPPDGFTLASGDEVRIDIAGIGTLSNTVA